VPGLAAWQLSQGDRSDENPVLPLKKYFNGTYCKHILVDIHVFKWNLLHFKKLSL